MRLTEAEWEKIKTRFELGEPLREIANDFPISHVSIGRRARKENWQIRYEDAIKHRVAKGLALEESHLPFGDKVFDREAVTQALQNEAERRIAVIRRHRDEWDDHYPLMQRALMEEDIDLARIAKITAETLTIRQNGERAAWGIGVEDLPDGLKPRPFPVIDAENVAEGGKPSLIGLSEEELVALSRIAKKVEESTPEDAA